MQVTIGRGGYTPAENWHLWRPSHRLGERPGIVFLHGAGGNEAALMAAVDPAGHAVMAEVCETLGYIVLFPDFSTTDETTGAHTWFNDDSTTTIDNAITWARANRRMSADPVVLVGGSMGGGTGFNYWRRFAANVAGIVTVAGAADLDYHHSGNDAATGKYQVEIDAAHDGADYATVVAPTFNPVVFADDTIPHQAWHGDADPVAPLAHMQTLVALTGGDLTVVAGGTHSTTWDGVDADTIVAFIASL